jgi:uncharacterized lipoprotein YddW (UPF0748 family)
VRSGEHYQRYLEFRRENITRVVREVAQRAREIRPGVQISAAVFRNALSDRDSIGQDWQLWCESGWLDFVCPMNYIDSTRAFQSVILMQKSLVGKAFMLDGRLQLSAEAQPADNRRARCRAEGFYRV